MNKISSQCDHCQTEYDGVDAIGCGCRGKKNLGNIDQAIAKLQIQMEQMWAKKKNCNFCYHSMIGNGMRKKCVLNKDQKAKDCKAYKFYIQRKEEI